MPFSGEKKEFYNSGLNKFVNEAKSLAKFYTLPGIVAVKDFFRENGTAYIVMEYVDGITLKQHLANSDGKLRSNEVFELMRPIMKSLSQIHAEGIIHRDISPDNIMLTNKGDVKLLDFGAARDFISDGNKSLSVLLKPGYAPEEQYRTKGNQGPWTDVYALCATIYKMLTGITPPESLERFSQDDIIAPSKLGIQLSSVTENALLKGLAVFQRDRYQDIASLYNDIYGATQWVKQEPIYNYEQPIEDIKMIPIQEDKTVPIQDNKTIPLKEEFNNSDSSEERAEYITNNTSKAKDSRLALVLKISLVVASAVVEIIFFYNNIFR
jgi:serine/threonine protein kinase